MSGFVSRGKSISPKSRAFWWRRPHRVAAGAEAAGGTSGFTLIEVMIATMLLAVGLLGTAGMLTSTTRALSGSANRSIATTLAKERLEHIEHAEYATVTAANYPAESYQSMADFAQFQRTVTIALNTPVATTKVVTVTVSWRDPSNTVRTATVSAIITP